jgi:hypothetical protein
MSRLTPVAVAGTLLVLAAGCGDDGGGGPASELEAQVAAVVAGGAEDVRARLDSLGVDVEPSELEGVGGDDLSCPPVDDPDPGDRATCELSLDAAEVLVDIEFAADGSVSVVGVEVLELAGGDPDVEDAVAGVVADQLGATADPSEVDATCPGADDPQPGDEVRCRVTVGGGASLPVDFTVGDDGGLVLETAVLGREEVEAFLVAELAGPAEGDVEVDCGDEPVLAAPVDDVLLCGAVRSADGAGFDVVVRVRSVDGELAYEVTGR